MESRHQTLVNLGNDLVKLVRLGIISTTLLAQKNIYEYFKKQLETNNTSQAVLITSIEHKLQERQIYRIIKFMEEQSEI